MGIFRTQDISQLAEHTKSSEKNLGMLDLTLLSVGAVVGTGVMVLTGIVAATETGPSIILSFLIGGIIASIIVLCYAELCSSIPSSGGSYSFIYATLGEIVAYVAGLAIVCAYVLSCATVASGWSGYLINLLHYLGINLPVALYTIPSHGGTVNLPALLSVLVMAFIISKGTKESKIANDIMVITKIVVITLFVVVGAFYINSSNWTPFFPDKISGMIAGSTTVFFSYCGFDTTASAANYVKNPKKTIPISLLVSLLICTVIYLLVSAVLTGITSYKNLDVADALSYTLQVAHRPICAVIVSLGSVIGILAVIFASLFATAQIMSTMSLDGLLPELFGKKDRHDTPYISLWSVSILSSLLAGFVNLDELADFASLSYLVVYSLVALSVVILRRKYKDLNTGFKIPWVPFIPLLGVACCVLLIMTLKTQTILVSIVMLLLIIASYFLYAYRQQS